MRRMWTWVVGPAAVWAALAGAFPRVQAQPAAAEPAQRPVWRCPGPPVEYTNDITPEQARERGCRVIEATPVTVVQPPPRQTSVPAAAPPSRPQPGSGTSAVRSETRVDPAAQRARDAEARRILEAELRREEERLATLRREFNNGEPERRGDERNFARYQERVAEMRAAITRKEADIAALKREIAKFGP